MAAECASESVFGAVVYQRSGRIGSASQSTQTRRSRQSYMSPVSRHRQENRRRDRDCATSPGYEKLTALFEKRSRVSNLPKQLVRRHVTESPSTIPKLHFAPRIDKQTVGCSRIHNHCDAVVIIEARSTIKPGDRALKTVW